MEAGKPTSFPITYNNRSHICVKSDRYLSSLGTWFEDNPFDFVLPVTLCQIVMIIVVTQTICYLLKPLKTPKFICCVLGGILLGRSGLGLSHEFKKTLFPEMQAPIVIMMSRLGAANFAFIIALKMDVVTNLRSAKRYWRFAVIPLFFSSFVISFLLFLLRPHGTFNEAIHNLSNASSLSSFAVISEVLLELNLITTELGQIALSTALFYEIMQWAMMLMVFATVQDIDVTLCFLSSCCIFMLFCVFIVRPMMKIIIQRTPAGMQVKEAYVVLILLGVLVVAAVSDTMGLSYFIGPLIFGLVIPNGPPLATTIIEKSEAVTTYLLMPFFFATVGLSTDFTIIENWDVALMFQSILFAGFLAKVFACVIVAPTYNISPKHGMVLGLMLSFKGILELIIFEGLNNVGIINHQMFTQLVLYVMLTTATCAPLIKHLYKHRPRVSKVGSINNEGCTRTIQSASVTSQFNVISCVHHEGNVHSMIALLEACNPSQESPMRVHVIHLIELLGKCTPILLPMNTHNRNPLSVNYPSTNQIMRAFQNYSRNSKGPVAVLSYANVAPYNSMHEAVCALAEGKSVPFLVIPFHENDQINNRHASTPIRELNASFQIHARCTVGILVDKYSRLGLSSSKLSFHVAVFFIGGPDDREALALGMRMLKRVNTRVTLLRFAVKSEAHQTIAGEHRERRELEGAKEDERLLDDSLIDEFKGMKLGSDDTVCHEIFVEDSMVNVLEAIRGMDMEAFDLVVIGKRHCVGSFADEEAQMTGLMDNVDQLGVVGDMLASVEFCDGKISLLVMQCGDERVKQRFDKDGHAHKTTYL